MSASLYRLASMGLSGPCEWQVARRASGWREYQKEAL
jgi:hypothetical protein